MGLALDKRESVDVDLKWMGGKRSEAKIRRFTVSIDNPGESGREDTGPMPTELLLASLGGCFMIDFVRFAEKMRINLKGLCLKISGLRERGENPRFTQISVSISPELERIDYQRIQKLGSLVEKTCTVANTLKNETRVSFRIHPLK